jgi:hypothetical protein
MEPVKYQFTKREFVVVTTIRFWCQKRLVLYQLILIALIIISWSVEAPTYSYVVCLVVVFICLPMSTVCHFNKIAKANPEQFTSETTLSADSDGIKVNSAVKSSSLNWPIFKKWTENKKYIFLYLGDFEAVTILKRAFTNEQLMEFKTFLSEKIWPFPGDTRTNDEHYAKHALILALTALVFATSPVTMSILLAFFDICIKGCTFLKSVFAFLAIFGWIPGLVIAIIAHKMGKRMKGSPLIINTTRIASVLAMLGTLGFGILLILAMLLNHFAPRGY